MHSKLLMFELDKTVSCNKARRFKYSIHHNEEMFVDIQVIKDRKQNKQNAAVPFPHLHLFDYLLIANK